MAGGDDRKKLTWREIDQRREKGGRRDEPRPSTSTQHAQKSYRAALERAFATGTVDELAKTLTRSSPPARAPRPEPAPVPEPEPVPSSSSAPAPPLRDPEKDTRAKLLARITTSDTRDSITRAIDAYLARYPSLPPDLDVLTKALSHHDVDQVTSALDALGTLLSSATDKPRRTRTLAGQLRLLEDTHDDPAIRRRAADVRARL